MIDGSGCNFLKEGCFPLQNLKLFGVLGRTRDVMYTRIVGKTPCRWETRGFSVYLGGGARWLVSLGGIPPRKVRG